jgi:predicted DNA-binding transcriptional regulator AlpA
MGIRMRDLVPTYNKSGGMNAKRQDGMAYPPRAMRAERAAAYLDISRSKFLELVDRGILPKPKMIDSMRMWDRLSLDAAFSECQEPEENGTLARRNSFDDVLRGKG